MATTTNYAWETPDDTDLVKDGAAAIRTLGSSIDTTTKALNPSTTLGDIEYRSSTANTNTRLAIGSTGQVLTVSGGVPVWAAAAGGGKVLQVVQGLATSNSVTTSTSFVDCGLSASITPSSASSKVLVFLNIAAAGKVNNGGGTSARFNLVRDTTTVIRVLDRGLFTNTNDYLLGIPVNAVYLDSPASTSSLTYKAQMSSSSGTEIGINYWATNTVTSSIVLVEMGA